MPSGRTYASVDELYRAHGEKTLRLAYLLTGDRVVAEDIVQDAFVRLLGRLRSIRDPGALQAYVSRTVVNLAKNHRRGQARLRSFIERGPGTSSEASLMPDIEAREGLHASLLDLPYRQRAALVLRYCEDLPEAEVAEALGTTPKAVRSLVGRGLATLRDPNGRIPNE